MTFYFHQGIDISRNHFQGIIISRIFTRLSKNVRHWATLVIPFIDSQIRVSLKMLRIRPLRNDLILVPNHDREVAPVEKTRKESENNKIFIFECFLSRHMIFRSYLFPINPFRMLRILGYKLGTRNLFLSTQSQNIYFGKTRTPEGIAYGRDQQQKLRDIFENEIEEKIYKDNMKSSERPVSSPVSPARIPGPGEK